MRAGVQGLVVVAAMWWATAHAEPGTTEPIAVTYRASGECPDTAYFLGQVSARTTRMRIAAEGEPGRRFVVDVRLSGRRARGQLRVQNPDGTEALREVSGDTCLAVVDALALVGALAIDPQASLAPVRPSAPPPPPPIIVAPVPVPVPPRPKPLSRWRFGAGMDVGVVEGIQPDAALELAPFLEVSRVAPRWSPALRIGFVYDVGYTIHTVGGSARLTSYLGRADLCPGRIYLYRGLHLDLCARLDVGVVWARGVEVQNPREVLRTWVAPGVLVGLEREFFDRLFLHLGVAVSFPLYRDHFVLDPNFEVEEVPVVGVRGAIGLGVHFL